MLGRKKSFQMPISTGLYTELRFTISDYMQRGEWNRLFEVCGTDDDETARTIGVIMSGYNPKRVWEFVDYSSKLNVERRLEKATSVATVCYILARMGQTNIRRTLSVLRQLLWENRDLREPVASALSNMWVLDPHETSRLLLSSWTIDGQTKAIQEVAVESCRYLGTHVPSRASNFLERVSRSNLKGAAERAGKLLEAIGQNGVTKKGNKDQKKRKHESKSKQEKKHKKKNKKKK